eukprot:13585688-Alexandrium_andersonii.AAC.1
MRPLLNDHTATTGITHLLDHPTAIGTLYFEQVARQPLELFRQSDRLLRYGPNPIDISRARNLLKNAR